MTIHRFWTSDSPPPYPILDKYVSLSYDARDWTFDNLPLDIRDIINMSTKYLTDSQDAVRHCSNVARLYILFNHGGIYIDHDILPLVNLEQITQPFVGSSGATHPTAWSCLLGFQPEHPVLDEALSHVANIKGSESQLPLSLLSGSQLINTLLTPDITLVPLACDSIGRPFPNQYSAVAFHLSSTSYARHSARFPVPSTPA